MKRSVKTLIELKLSGFGCHYDNGIPCRKGLYSTDNPTVSIEIGSTTTGTVSTTLCMEHLKVLRDKIDTFLVELENYTEVKNGIRTTDTQ